MNTFQIICTTIVFLILAIIAFRERKDISLSLKVGEGGYSARKLIMFQLIGAVGVCDIIFAVKLYQQVEFFQNIYIEWLVIHITGAAFYGGYLLLPEVIKLILAVRNGTKPEEAKEEKTEPKPEQ